jgi:hypothetical protein|nr:MAG TPA: hypothetical protein [Caudoviricetes sp.]
MAKKQNNDKKANKDEQKVGAKRVGFFATLVPAIPKIKGICPNC